MRDFTSGGGLGLLAGIAICIAVAWYYVGNPVIAVGVVAIGLGLQVGLGWLLRD